MNKLRYMILAMAAILSFAAISCAPVEEYTPGQPDIEGCFGVYFPTQEASSKTITLEPTDKRRVKVTVSRGTADGDITVPFELTDEEGIFEVDDIIFEDGQTSTSFHVYFDDAVIGEKYSCTIEVTDPLYVSNYRVYANYITINVIIASWEELGEATVIDQSFKNSQTNVPLTATTKVYRNGTDNNLYRVDDPYAKYMEAAGALSPTAGPDYFEFRVLQRGESFTPYEGFDAVTIPVDNMVFYEPIFTFYKDGQYGDAYYYHPSYLDGYEDPMLWYENRVLTWQDDEKTMPGLVQLAPSFYFPSAGGYAPEPLITIVFPGAKLTDYTMSIKAGLPENGEIPINFTLGEDVAEVRYAVFSGTLSEDKITENADALIAKTIEYETISEGGEYILSNLGKTGPYTIVAVGFDKDGNKVNYAYDSFGYLKAGDTNPVTANCGVIVSDKYAPEGYTSENSLEFYIYGKDLTSVCYGLYRQKDFDEKYDSVIKDLMRMECSEAELEAINTTGLSDVFIRLNSGMEYVLVVYASNGYEGKILSAGAKLNGELDPLQMTYELDVLRPASSKADYCKEWAFWTGTPDSNGRVEVGPVTITDGGIETVKIKNEDGSEGEMEVEMLNVKGFWKPAVDEKYLKDDTMKWQYYEGAIVPLHDEVGVYTNQSGERLTMAMISFFESGNGGFVDGAVCGAFTDEGNVAFVDMETGNFPGEGAWWFTALCAFSSDGEYLGEVLAYDEMLFADPANLPEKETDSTEAQLQQVKIEFQKNFNYVEYKQFQIYTAIDNVFGDVNIKSFNHRAELDITPVNTPVKCSLEPTGKPSSNLRSGKPGSVRLR